MTRIGVLTSGGDAPGMNADIRAVVRAGITAGAEVFGVLDGCQGAVDGGDRIRTLTWDDVAGIAAAPGTVLGTSRCRTFRDHDGRRDAVASLVRAGIDRLVVLGGDGSLTGADLLATEWPDHLEQLVAHGVLTADDATAHPALAVAGIGGSIDNDLVGTDHTPGFGSAAKFIATTMAEVARDSDVYDLTSVTFVEIMGRDAGWLAGSACLAGTSESPCPDLVLLPEAPVTEDQLIERLSTLLGEKNTVVVAVSEGLRRPDGTLMCEQWERAADGTRLDAFGHVASLSGTSRYLASVVRSELGCKTRAVELSTLQRCASHIASATDLDEAFRQGGAGVLAASDGRTGVMCALERMTNHPYVVESVLADVHEVANQARPVPRDWIAEDGMSVTSRFEDYARPLIGGEVSQVYIDGIPRHIESL